MADGLRRLAHWLDPGNPGPRKLGIDLDPVYLGNDLGQHRHATSGEVTPRLPGDTEGFGVYR